MSCRTSGTSHTGQTSVGKGSATTFAVADPMVSNATTQGVGIRATNSYFWFADHRAALFRRSLLGLARPGWPSTIANVPGEVAARAYLITAEQFVDVLAQETRRSPGMALDLGPVFRGDRYSNGVGGYPILVRVGGRNGVPLVTFTRDRRNVSTLVAPTVLYLAAMATGLREAHGWSRTQIDRYLSALPGAASSIAYITTQCVDDLR